MEHGDKRKFEEAVVEASNKRPRTRLARHPVFKDGKVLLSGKIATAVKDKYSFEGKPQTNEQYLELIEASCDIMTPKLPGKPVIMNHGRATKHHTPPGRMGTIVDSEFDKQTKDWWIQFELDQEHPAAKALQQLVEQGQCKDGLFGLSLSHLYDSNEPTEVSLTFDPAREGSWVQLSAQQYNAQPAGDSLIEASKNMAQSMEISSNQASTATTKSGKDTKEDSAAPASSKTLPAEFAMIDEISSKISDPKLQERFLQMQLEQKKREQQLQSKYMEAESKAKTTEEKLKAQEAKHAEQSRQTVAAFFDVYNNYMQAKNMSVSPQHLQQLKSDVGQISDPTWLSNVTEGLVTASKVIANKDQQQQPVIEKKQEPYTGVELSRLRLLAAYEEDLKKGYSPYMANQNFSSASSNNSKEEMMVSASRDPVARTMYQNQDIFQTQMRALDADQNKIDPVNWYNYAPEEIQKGTQLREGSSSSSSNNNQRGAKRARAEFL